MPRPAWQANSVFSQPSGRPLVHVVPDSGTVTTRSRAGGRRYHGGSWASFM